jgi:Tol biopolymer transport system component
VTATRITLMLISVALVGVSPARALFDEYNHPELKWLSFETEHFQIYYAEGLEDVAALAAQVAEEIHEPLCTMYDYRPDGKVALIFSDDDDIANAATYFQSNKIHFYATSMAWDFRGTHNWLRNVVTHEYTHMIQLGASRKWSRHVPALYAQLLGYEPERRPDVLYGYPNRLVSWPLPSVTVPAWFAEGTAQFQFSGNGYDSWDSHRDMLLRQATLSHRLLSFEDMGYFGKNSLESEGVYNQGFALTRYIVEKTGDRDVLRRVSHDLARPLPVTLDGGFERATGKSGAQWYAEWKADIERKYGALRDELAPFLTPADTVPADGYVNLYPRLSPGGRYVAFISNQNRDYFGQTSLYLYDFEKAELTRVTGAVQGALAWLPDTSGIIFSRRALRPFNGSLQHDLYVHFLKDKREVRLSRGLRAESVDVSPDGRWLVFTINEQGRRDLAFAPLPDLSRDVKLISPANVCFRHPSAPQEQCYLPRWSPDGRFIAVSQHLMEGRNVCVFEVGDSCRSLTLRHEFSGENAELRDPSWARDGRHLLVSWDEPGIANVYRLNIEDGSRQQITCVLGGAFYPDRQGERLVYTDFRDHGFRICKCDNPSPLKPERTMLDSASNLQASYISRIPKPHYTVSATRVAAKPYKPAFESLYWFPRIAFDYGTFKPGTYLLVNDFLEKLSFLGGFAVNQKRDYDLFGIVEYRVHYPTFFVEYYNIQRRLSSVFADSTRIVGEEEEPGFIPVYDRYRIRFRYNLNEVDLGARVPVAQGSYGKITAVYNRYNADNRFDDGTAIGITYFKGWAGRVGLFTDQRRPGIASEINPTGGYKAYLEYTRANYLFYTDLEIGGDAVGLREIYAPYNYDMMEGGLEKYLSLPGWDHTLELRGRGGYLGERVDPFFFLYAGGLPGMRGYSYYSLGGERVAIGTATYRFPIVRRAAFKLWPFSLNRIYGGVFTDIGDAWRGDFDADRLKTDVGAGLRIQLHSFYSYPTAVALDAAYGFNRFSVAETGQTPTEYGKEWRFYLTVLFQFYSPFERGRLLGSGELE